MKTFYIGRNPQNDIVIAEMSVSDRHGEITIEDNGQIVYTDHSSNGTYINGIFLQHSSQIVSVGDHIVFPGGIEFNWAILSPYIIPQGCFETTQPTTSVPYNGNSGFVPPLVNNQPQDYSSYPANDSTERVTLNFSLTFKEGLSSGLKNALSLLAILLLAILTCWIPYINLGVLIAISTLPDQWSRGEVVSPLSIFKSCYRRNMGTYLLLLAFLGFGVLLATLSGVIPGIVLSFAWSLATLFVVVEGKNPIEALNVSNNCTYGSKWTIFAVLLVFGLCAGIVSGIVGGLSALIITSLADSGEAAVVIVSILFGLIMLALSAVIYSISIGISGSIWKQLKQNANN
ncbi:MAG: FHA domain-containing protein [Alistipes sp.]|nr:FHA domain-containing protein [Alistipes sp.]